MLSMFSRSVTDLFIFMFLFFLFHIMTLISSDFISGLIFFLFNFEQFFPATLTVFNMVFRGQCFCVQLFVVYNSCLYFSFLCFHSCGNFFLKDFFTAIFKVLLCLLISLG